MKVDIHNPSDVLAWMFVLAMVGIGGMTIMGMSIMGLYFGRGNVFLCVGGIVLGTPMAIWMIWGLIQFNKQYHRDRIAAIKDNPKSVLCGWEAEGKEYLLTLEGFVDHDKFIAFDDYSYHIYSIEHREHENEDLELVLNVKRIISTNGTDSSVIHEFKYIIPPSLREKSLNAERLIQSHYKLLEE